MRLSDTSAPIAPALLTEAEAAIYLGVSRSLLRQQRCEGEREGRAPLVPYVRFGRAIRYRVVDLDHYIEKHLVSPEPRVSM